MKKSFVSIIVLLGLTLSFSTFAQKGSIFPSMDVHPVKGEDISLPDAGKGKLTIYGLAYSQKSDKELKTWFRPMYDEFIKPPSGGLFIPEITYDVNLYFVAMLRGVNAAAGGTLEHKFDEELEEDLKPHVAIYKGKIKDYKKKLKLGKKDHPYFFMVDENGKIIYATYGPYSKKKMNEITDIVSKHQ